MIETVQQYWEVSNRCARAIVENFAFSGSQPFDSAIAERCSHGQPVPVRPIGTAATRDSGERVSVSASRRSHAWQFWMDAGSTRWLSGVDACLVRPVPAGRSGWPGLR
jgi:hypothetical protein